ncbi:serine-protein kinase ATM [Caerostris darwini]|uniref:non-specific serine/threonine protein kinase n=1 Tax=Caerostris darwini TaxID=1538125 RepID=A0AAV4U7B5_9ARAC|nr:serine-protein kinase ATM [Caerostris darwini]
MKEIDIATKLKDCLQHLVEGKVLERKKKAEELNSLLAQEFYIQHLNRNSIKKTSIHLGGSCGITWKIVFSKIKLYIEQESQKFRERENSNQNLSATVQTNLLKDKKRCTELFRTYMKAIKQNQHYDMAKMVMDHVLAVLDNQYTRTVFGCEYSLALSKNILSDPFMCLKIPAADFDAAIWFYCKIIKSPPQGWDRSSMTHVLLHLLTIRSNMGAMNASKILEFFEFIFDAVKSEKISNHHENLLKALLHICRILGADYRLRLCQLGESIMSPVMQLWKTRPSEICFELMLEFVSFQLTLHHPRGATIQGKGACAFNWSLWKSHLLSLFKICVLEIDELCEKNKYSSSKESILKPIFVSVFVEICAQVFCDSVGVLDVTQMPSTHDISQPSKKRRVEVCFKTFIDSLTSSKIVPWLQVISMYIMKYPEKVPFGDAEHLLEILIEINLSCNQFETKNWLLTCFQAFVQSFGTSNENFGEYNFQLQRLWDIAVKSVALMNQCQETAHMLLSTLLSHKLITPKAEFYKLYSQGSSNHVTFASLRTLRVFLEKYSSPAPFDVCYQSNIVASTACAMTFENQILDWLFSRKSDDNSPFQIFSNDSDCTVIEEFAYVLSLICLRNPELRNPKELPFTDIEKTKWISDLEEELLQITFDLPLRHVSNKYESENIIPVPASIISSAWEKILNFFIGNSSSIFEQQTTVDQASILIIFMKHASFLVETLYIFFSQGIIKDADLNSNHFISFIKKFLNNVVELEMQKEVDKLTKSSVQMFKDFICNTVAVFNRIKSQFSNSLACKFVASIANAIPTEILKDLLNFSLENTNEKKSFLNASVSAANQNLNLSHNKKNKYSFDDDDYSDIEMECLDSVPDSEEVAFSMETESISADFQEQLHCLEILGDYCGFISSETHIKKSDSFPEIMIKKLLSVISIKAQNLNDVHLILTSLKCILLNKCLEDNVIEAVISAIKKLLNQFSVMQDICIVILKLFRLLFQHVIKKDTNQSEQIMQNKSHMLHLIRILSKKELDKKGSSVTSYFIAKNLLSMLKMESFISWPESSEKNCAESNLENFVIYTFVEFLNCPFVAVRLFVANNINAVITAETLDLCFDFSVKEIFNFLHQESTDLDACQNRISTFFHFMSHMILQFPCLENEAIFMMCKIVHIKKIDQSFIVKVFARLSSVLGFSNTKNFIELNLMFIFQKWIQEKFSIEDFPFMILNLESCDEFIREFFKVLIPIIFFLDDQSGISKIEEKLHITKSELIYACLPNLQAQILSDFATNNDQRNPNKAKSVLNSMIPAEVSEKVFHTKLDEFIVCLLKMLKDDQSDHLSRCQVHNAYSLTAKDFSLTISYIMSSVEYRGSFISFLNQKGNCIQGIFLSLNIMLSKALRSHDRGHVLFMYKTFLELICSELGPGLNCSYFVVKEIVYTIINFLTDYKMHNAKDSLSIIYCCDILQLVCSQTMLHFQEIIGEFLPFIVSNLISFVEETECGKKVLSLLSFLIIDSEVYLAQYIPFLDPFPNNIMFQSIANKYNQIKYKSGKLSLEQEITLFLKSYKMMGKATVNGLQHLCRELKTRQTELLEMLNSIKENILFSEDVKTSVHHQLVCELASICALDHVPLEIQKAASDCMGALGPVVFSSVVLQPSSKNSNEGLNSLQLGYAAVLDLFTGYLFDKKIDVKVTTSEILKELFETRTAYTFFIDYQALYPNNHIKKYAIPFFSCQNANNLKSVCQYEYKVEDIQDLSVWIPITSEHFEWITNLVCTLIESGLTKDNFYECLIPLCRKQVQFCEKILPYVIHAILLRNNDQTQNVISFGIDAFFSHFSQWIHEMHHKNGSAPTPVIKAKFSKASVQAMLSVLHHIWLYPKQESKNEKNILKDFWLDISFLEVAQAAQYCSAYFTAVLYTELWCDKMREKSLRSDHSSDHSDSSGSLDCSPLSYIGSKERAKASLVYDILLDTYSKIGDSDAISGCEVVATDSQAILKHTYLTEKKWDGLLKISDLNNSTLEILQALQQNNLNSVLQGYIQSLIHTQDEKLLDNIREYRCEAAWRMGQWDLPMTENDHQGFQECLYKCQQSLISENSVVFEKYFKSAQKTQFEYLRHTSLEAARNVLPALSRIQMLSILEDFSNIQLNPNTLQEILNVWNLQDQMPYEDFEFVEPVSWLKCALLKYQIDVNSSKQLQARTTVIPELKNFLERYATSARNELHLEVASKAIHVLRKLPNTEEEDILRWQIEEAKILWTKKEYSVANKILKSTLPFIEKFAKENPKFWMYYGQALTLRGRWLAETCNENSSVIMRDYLEKALDVLKNINGNNDKIYASSVCNAFLAVARYADGQYQSIINYEKSTAYQAKLESIKNSREQANQLRIKDITDDQRKLHLILTRQADIDQTEMKSVEADKKRFLEKAVINYLQCLRGSDTHDLWIFRLISLWFQNLDDDEINNIIKDKISELQTYKFLPLMYQLAARMGTQASNTFTHTLLMLIRNISVDHPHHSLPVILALNNADKDPADKKEKSDQTVHLQQAEVPAVKERMNAAKKLLSALQKSKIGPLVKSYSSLCDAYISLAYLAIPKNVKKGIIPKDQALLKFKELHNIPVITEEVKVDRSCEYKNIIGIHSFHNEFRMCGGITLPKVIKCIGMDGKEREQLVKGSDDLRQDAVMQQVFYLVNYLLKQKMETRQRKLHIRTYKVVPVSRRSGVLQWCEGTEVLSHYLVGPGGAHRRYYPSFATPQECRKKMMSIANVLQLPKKRQIYDSICAEFPPVFRYFFLENFPEPSAWFERRQSYIKSVAASSIVGYIMGLGDRHVNNILIDKNTAEVVHIDFGIAFEKGKILATPETVPFRLTRDIVDGMGINGVEGTFKRCSEKTLEVMRNSQDVLLTILEVLLHDPLYEWSVPAGKSSQRADTSSTSNSQKEINTLAERALMRLQQKLQGLEEGVAMSIEGQVNLLIQQARDPNNLCRIFAGWQPYL